MSQQEHELWCGAEHEATGAICQLPPGHLQNHRGAFNNGIVQWPHQPIIRMSATPAPPEASHRALREWQPIETAPKDGTQVWAWDAERGSNPALWVDGAWWITYDDAMIHPTHWMPLPDPPAALSTGTETQEPQA
jgi:hypothetical protein